MRFNVTEQMNANLTLDDLRMRESLRIREIKYTILQGLHVREDEQGLHSFSLVASDSEIAFKNAMASKQQQNRMEWLVTAQYRIPVHAIDVADVFVGLQEACARAGVTDWALNETTLEDVFVRVANE
jgi:hypothetical protein